jgi:long-chain acyl-CoA synthetase
MRDTIPSRFLRQADALGRKPLFFVKRDGRYHAISWSEASQDMTRLGMFLLHLQVNPGDRILLLSENRPEWEIVDLAVQAIGGWSVPLYPSLTPDDLAVIGADCRPVIGIASTSDQLKKLLAVKPKVPSLHTLVLMEGSWQDPNVTRWQDALSQGQAIMARMQELFHQRLQQLDSEGTCTLIYTSGTTGEPKGVMLSHRNFLSNVDACRQVIPVSSSDLHLSFLPLSHVFERMAGWYLMFSAGAAVAFAESLDTVPQNMVEVRPTIMLGVPRFFEKLYARVQEALRQAPPIKRRLIHWALRVGNMAAAYRLRGAAVPAGVALQRWVAQQLVFKKFQARLGGRLRFFVSGSAPLSREIAEFFYAIGVTILEGYGLTETSPVIAVNRLRVPKFGSVGQTIHGVEVWIADDGEILTRGPHVMQGYYRKPEVTRETIVDGWLHTGDIGRLDEDGYLYITDRKKDLIKTAGGKFVAPQKLENLFVIDPYISQAFVYGDKERYCVALIVPNPEPLRRYAQEQEIAARSMRELIDDPRIRDFYWSRIQERQQALASFEQVKRIALLDHEFSQADGELTPTMKAKRQIIAQRYASLLRSLYDTPPA